MPNTDDANRPMTDDEWWDGLDRELSQVLVGMNRAHLAGVILVAAGVAAGFLVYAN